MIPNPPPPPAQVIKEAPAPTDVTLRATEEAITSDINQLLTENPNSNNRKRTPGRSIQVIHMPNGKTKEIRHLRS